MKFFFLAATKTSLDSSIKRDCEDYHTIGSTASSAPVAEGSMQLDIFLNL
jgi:hypothetical protein